VDHQISSSATLRQLNAPASSRRKQVLVYSSTRFRQLYVSSAAAAPDPES